MVKLIDEIIEFEDVIKSDDSCQSDNTLVRTWTQINNCNFSSGVNKNNSELISCNYSSTLNLSNTSSLISNSISNNSPASNNQKLIFHPVYPIRSQSSPLKSFFNRLFCRLINVFNNQHYTSCLNNYL